MSEAVTHGRRINALIDAATEATQRGDVAAARDHLRSLVALVRAGPVPDPVRLAACLSDLGECATMLGDYAAARGHLEEALDLQQRQLGSGSALAHTLRRLSRVQLALGDAEGAMSRLDAASQQLEGTAGNARHLALSEVESEAGSAFAKLGKYEEALTRYEQALTLRRAALGDDPETATLLGVTGLALFALARYEAARDRFGEMVTLLRGMQAPGCPQLQELLVKALCNLGRAAHKLGDDDGAVRRAEEALAVDPDQTTAYHLLVNVRAAQENWPEAHRLAGLAYERQSYIEDPGLGADRTLLIVTSLDGNTPHEHLLARRALNKVKWFIAYSNPSHEAALPRYDAVLNLAGDPDHSANAVAAATAFHARCPVPFLNDPARIPPTRRDRLPDLVAGIDGLVTATARRLAAETLRGPKCREALAEAGLSLPLLLRQPGKHGGDSVRRVNTPEALAAECATLDPDNDVYVAAFHDYVSPDGCYRKYRMIFVDRCPYPYHLAISPNWLVHYFSADMQAHPWKVEEERRFLENPEAVLGERAMAALAEIARRLDLDYAGADFTLLPDGRVLLFEANATMLVHAEAENGPLAHKNAYIGRIFEAFDVMLDRALEASPP